MRNIIAIFSIMMQHMNRYGIVLMETGDSGGVRFTDLKYHYFLKK